ncbi:MAG: preprotein translocase subunit YajC [Porphyromonas sp.]|nr:preprotein translocase subunit YajC [Porphyromonas sp.]
MNLVFLQAAPTGGGYMQFILIGLMVVVFWLLIIRPNSKRQKEIQRQRENLKTGDKVIISDGIMGTLREINKENGYVVVEIAENVKVRVTFTSVFPLIVEEKKK